MKPTILAKAEDFLWKHARLIDRRLYEMYFLGGSKEMVITALLAYQNPDGGFGNALEPDKRDPHSQPVDVSIALEILDEAGGFGHTKLIMQICDYLAGISLPGGGVPFALPTVNDYPHAPWWRTPENPPAELNPTAAIAGLLLKHRVDHPWVVEAESFCWQAVAQSETNQYHDLMPMITFLENAPDRSRAGHELERLAAHIRERELVAMDTAAQGYVQKPLDWAPTPGAYLRQLFSDEVIAEHLAWMESCQQEDGGWPITWQPVSPAVEMEWRGQRTLHALNTLRAYGVL